MSMDSGFDADACVYTPRQSLRRSMSVIKSTPRTINAPSPYYLQDELKQRKLTLPEPNYMKNRKFHVYCSKTNPGARELIDELKAWVASRWEGADFDLRVTEDRADIAECEFFLVYLTDETWTIDGTS